MCVHTHAPRTQKNTHTHKHKQVCSLINTTCTHCAYSYTYILAHGAWNTHTHNQHLGKRFSLNVCCRPLHIPPHINTHLYLSPSLIIVQCHTHAHRHTHTNKCRLKGCTRTFRSPPPPPPPHSHTHTHTHT